MSQGIRTPKQLGVNVRANRKELNKTQTEVAKRAGMKQKQVSMIEQGIEGVRLITLFKLLSAMGLEVVIRPKVKSKKSLKALFDG